MSSQIDDSVNLEGVFIRPQKKHPGIPVTPFLHIATLRECVQSGDVSKYIIAGHWACRNQDCEDCFGFLEAEAVLLWNDGCNALHYVDSHQCKKCGWSCLLIPGFAFIIYLSQKGFDELSAWVRGKAPRLQQNNGLLGQVLVLANRGARQVDPSSQNP